MGKRKRIVEAALGNLNKAQANHVPTLKELFEAKFCREPFPGVRVMKSKRHIPGVSPSTSGSGLFFWNSVPLAGFTSEASFWRDEARQETQNSGKHEHDAEFVCTACGRSVAIVEVREHPVLHVGICKHCYDFQLSDPFTKDNPHDPLWHENECRGCGDGGEVIPCDSCPKVFCKYCIKTQLWRRDSQRY